jgi:hypothetical protein
MADFITVSEIQNYSTLMTCFLDLRDNKKNSFVYNDDSIIKQLCYSKFVNENSVQSILLDRAIAND